MRISDWSSDVCSSDLLAGFAAGRLDHVGVDGALRQPLDVVQLGGLFVEDFHEQPADDLALGFGIANPGQRRQIALGSIDAEDRKSVVEGKSVSVRVDLGGARIIKKKKKK